MVKKVPARNKTRFFVLDEIPDSVINVMPEILSASRLSGAGRNVSTGSDSAKLHTKGQ
jgi:hypothetical protein